MDGDTGRLLEPREYASPERCVREALSVIDDSFGFAMQFLDENPLPPAFTTPAAEPWTCERSLKVVEDARKIAEGRGELVFGLWIQKLCEGIKGDQLTLTGWVINRGLDLAKETTLARAVPNGFYPCKLDSARTMARKMIRLADEKRISWPEVFQYRTDDGELHDRMPIDGRAWTTVIHDKEAYDDLAKRNLIYSAAHTGFPHFVIHNPKGPTD